MNTTELKNLAEAAIYNDTEALPHALTVFRNAANPSAILKLLAINAELVEALKVSSAHVVELCTVFNIPLPDASIEKISAALAKAEGGEL